MTTSISQHRSTAETKVNGRVNGSAINMMPNGAAPAKEMPALRQVCLEMQRKVDGFLATQTKNEVLRGTQEQVRIARGVIEEALMRYRPEELSLSYNGGKDCLVLLVLLLASLPVCFPPSSSTTFPSSLQALYIRPPSPFPEVDAFVRSSAQTYHLSLSTSQLPMKAALKEYLDIRPLIKAVFVGTRRTDPHGSELEFFHETDRDWPRFMRVHPVVDWHYREVWAFIRALEIPYCELYDKGYTSLGGTNDTLPNPALKRTAGGKEGMHAVFRPAYELMDDEEERLGRDR